MLIFKYFFFFKLSHVYSWVYKLLWHCKYDLSSSGLLSSELKQFWPFSRLQWTISIIKAHSLNSHNMKFFLAKVYLFLKDKRNLFSSHPGNINAIKKAYFQNVTAAALFFELKSQLPLLVAWIITIVLTSFLVLHFSFFYPMYSLYHSPSYTKRWIWRSLLYTQNLWVDFIIEIVSLLVKLPDHAWSALPTCPITYFPSSHPVHPFLFLWTAFWTLSITLVTHSSVLRWNMFSSRELRLILWA